MNLPQRQIKLLRQSDVLVLKKKQDEIENQEKPSQTRVQTKINYMICL